MVARWHHAGAGTRLVSAQGRAVAEREQAMVTRGRRHAERAGLSGLYRHLLDSRAHGTCFHFGLELRIRKLLGL